MQSERQGMTVEWAKDSPRQLVIRLSACKIETFHITEILINQSAFSDSFFPEV